MSTFRGHEYLAALACLGTTALAGPSVAGSALVVAVLDFDNHTKDPELDVLGRGLADMMVTDLSAVSGIELVERAKLDSVLGELALQKGKYFDPKTAVSVGKGVGAKYVLLGAIAALAPELRLDIRLVEIATSKIIVADKVVGPKTSLFSLEEQLVKKFVAGLEVKLSKSWRPKGPDDVGTLLEYAKGIDSRERGDLDAAEKKLSAVVKKSPTFVLARTALSELRSRLEVSRLKRSNVIDTSAAEIVAKAQRFVTTSSASERERWKTRLAYRNLLRWAEARRIRPLLAPRGLIRRGREAEAKAGLTRYYEQSMALLADGRAYVQKHTQTLPNGVSWVDTSLRFSTEDEKLARAGGFTDSPWFDAVRLTTDTADFLLLGRMDDGSDDTKIVGPTLADLDPTFEPIGFGLFEDAWKQAEAGRSTQPYLEHMAISALDTHAEALLLRRGKKQAVEKWQEILDRYPTNQRYANIERTIQRQLGIEYDHSVDMLEIYPKGLEACEDMEVRKSMDTMWWWRSRREGIGVVFGLVKEIEEACKGRSSMSHFWEYLYSHAALFGASHEDCEIFDQFMKRYLLAGGAASSEAGYRKNYAPMCSQRSP
ncbi:MAG: hypothetical protein HY791_03985 [Deltaproteobacteria bacterium]|nr:hypothetical protein [Deltaproteobacteria bacterium]